MHNQSITIPLTQGKIALIDAADYPLVSQYTWAAAKAQDGRWYAMAYHSYSNGRQLQVLLHRFIMQPVDYALVDHINGDGLDCRRSNMRIVTHTQNMRNRRKQSAPTSSQYKGVSFKNGKWEATIKADGQYYLGRFDTENAAARAYDSASRHLHGEFGRLNFPDEEPATFIPNEGVRYAHNTSGYRGVAFEKRVGKWRARIQQDGKMRSLGNFETAEEAARAYDAKARELLGDQARLNFPD